MVQRVSLINSQQTQLNSDYDFSKIVKYLLDNTKGVLFSDLSSKPEFDLDLGQGEISSGTAIIKCTRTGTTPIPNQEFYAVFQSNDTVSVDVSVGQKIFIEIDNTLIQDPTLIEDTPSSTNYALGLNIGQIKSETSRPAHPNYIKLREITSGPTANDERETPKIKGNLVELTNITENIITTGDINAGGDVYGNRFFQNSFLNPTVNNELTPKGYVDSQILLAGSVENLKDTDTYILGEDVVVGDSLFREDMVEFSEADQVQAIGDTADNTRVAIPVFGSGVEDDNFDLALRKFVSPGVNLGVRIETDSTGPSGTLADANATSTVLESGLTTSLVDTNIQLAGNITLGLGVKYWIVLFAGTYGSETINGTNYFGVGYSIKNTTTRALSSYNGSTRSPNRPLTQNTGIVFTSTGTGLSGDSIGIRIFVKTEITITSITKDSDSEAITAFVKSDTGSITLASQAYSGNTATLGTPLLLQPGYYRIEHSGSGTRDTVRGNSQFIGGVFFDVISGSAGGVDNFLFYGIKSLGFTIAGSLVYVNSNLFLPQLLSKTNAAYIYKLPKGKKAFATENKSAGENCITIYEGLADLFSGMTQDTDMYLSDTPGAISSTPGSNISLVGKTITDTILNVGTYDGVLSISVGTTYYTNNKLIATINVSDPTNSEEQGCEVQISDDGFSFTKIAEQNNESGANGNPVSACAIIPRNKYFRLIKYGQGNGTPLVTVIAI